MASRSFKTRALPAGHQPAAMPLVVGVPSAFKAFTSVDVMGKAIILTVVSCLGMLSLLAWQDFFNDIQDLDDFIFYLQTRSVGSGLVLLASALGLIATLEFLWRAYLVLTYRPAPRCPESALPSLTVVVPAYNESEQVLATLRSVAASDYPRDRVQLIAVDDGSKDDTWHWMEEAAREIGDRLTLVRQAKNQGKRRALYEGIVRARGEIIVTIDSDSLVEPSTLKRLVEPFVAHPRVGGVAGNVRVLNREEGLIPRMLDVNFVFSFNFLRASQSRVNSVLCTPGALSAYRRELVLPVLEDWVEQTFMGRPAGIGEDRALTNMLLERGCHIHFAQDAVVYTKVPTTYKPLCKMYLRWARSDIRENLYMCRFAFRRFRPTSALGARVNLLLALLSVSAGEFFKVLGFYYLMMVPVIVGFNMLAGSLMAGLFPAAFFFWRYRNSDCLWAFPYMVFSTFAVSWVSLYAIFTIHRSGWLTRGLPGQTQQQQAAAA